MVTIDTWRWDYIGASGAGKVKTPALDRLAGEGVYEREAVTSCPLTTPAHASLFTGLDVLHHGILDCTVHRLGEGPGTLAEALRAGGVKTAAFVASETLGRRYGLDRGFDLYDDSEMAKRTRGDWLSASRDGAAVTGGVLAYLKAQEASAPLFIWAHYYDAHLPYRARPGLDEIYPRDLYAAQVAFVDGQVARLRSALEADAGRSWRVVVVGDHGEGLGERNEDTHGMGLYRATLHVPLILWPKPQGPLLHPRPWGVVDLFPTLRDWFGLPRGRGEDGESLFTEGRKGRWLAAVSVEPTTLFGVAPFKGIRQGRHFYLRDGSEELYDLASDPGERRDLSRERAQLGVLQSLRGISDKAWPQGWPRSDSAAAVPPQNQELRNLQSLGYLSGPVPSGAPLRHADMGKVLLDRSLWDRAREEAHRSKRGDGLMALLPRLVADYPASACLRKEYGVLLAQAGNLKEATRQMEAAVKLAPGDSASLSNLGGLYLREGRLRSAETCLRSALFLNPANPMAHKNLGLLYAEHLGNPSKAVEHYREYLRLDPGSPDAAAIKTYLADHAGSDPFSSGKQH